MRVPIAWGTVLRPSTKGAARCTTTVRFLASASSTSTRTRRTRCSRPSCSCLIWVGWDTSSRHHHFLKARVKKVTFLTACWEHGWPGDKYAQSFFVSGRTCHINRLFVREIQVTFSYGAYVTFFFSFIQFQPRGGQAVTSNTACLAFWYFSLNIP